MFKIANELLEKIKQAIKPTQLAAAEGITTNNCFGCTGACLNACSGACKGACEGTCTNGCRATCGDACGGTCHNSCAGRNEGYGNVE